MVFFVVVPLVFFLGQFCCWGFFVCLWVFVCQFVLVWVYLGGVGGNRQWEERIGELTIFPKACLFLMNFLIMLEHTSVYG